MEDYTLSVPEGDSKAIALLNYLKTLDFVQLKKAEKGDWWNLISSENQASVQRGVDDLDNGKSQSDNAVRNSVRQKIINAKNK